MARRAAGGAVDAEALQVVRTVSRALFARYAVNTLAPNRIRYDVTCLCRSKVRSSCFPVFISVEIRVFRTGAFFFLLPPFPRSVAIDCPCASATRVLRPRQALQRFSGLWGCLIGAIGPGGNRAVFCSFLLRGPEGPEPALGSLGAASCFVVSRESHFNADIALASRPSCHPRTACGEHADG